LTWVIFNLTTEPKGTADGSYFRTERPKLANSRSLDNAYQRQLWGIQTL